MQRVANILTNRLNYLSVYNKVVFQKEPKMRRRTITPIYPPPGLNLKLPDWKVDKFMLRIGNGCSEYADKFETLEDVFKSDKWQMKKKGVPPKIRKHVMRMREELRRGVLTFEYLERRTTVTL